MTNEENKTIKSVEVLNEDGTTEIVEKGMVVVYEPKEGGKVGVNLRFFNLKNDELAAILHGFSKLTELTE